MALDFLHLGLGSELCDYEQTWQLQRTLHAEVAAGSRPDTVLVLEHAEVYTAGKRTEPHERPVGSSIPVVEVDRGGKITWHGPGQLVVYPILRLPEAVGVVDYVRRLEEAMIALFAEYGLVTGRVRGRSGVWLAADATRPKRKIAAIGVRVASGTTMHGLAINVDPEMSGFAGIVPCGLSDVGVTSMAVELGESPSLAEVTHLLRPHLERYLAFEPYEQSPDIGGGDRVVVPPPARQTAGTTTYGLTVGAA
jgi:lipoyl(octanoyl) transferase